MVRTPAGAPRPWRRAQTAPEVGRRAACHPQRLLRLPPTRPRTPRCWRADCASQGSTPPRRRRHGTGASRRAALLQPPALAQPRDAATARAAGMQRETAAQARAQALAQDAPSAAWQTLAERPPPRLGWPAKRISTSQEHCSDAERSDRWPHLSPRRRRREVCRPRRVARAFAAPPAGRDVSAGRSASQCVPRLAGGCASACGPVKLARVDLRASHAGALCRLPAHAAQIL